MAERAFRGQCERVSDASHEFLRACVRPPRWPEVAHVSGRVEPEGPATRSGQRSSALFRQRTATMDPRRLRHGAPRTRPFGSLRARSMAKPKNTEPKPKKAEAVRAAPVRPRRPRRRPRAQASLLDQHLAGRARDGRPSCRDCAAKINARARELRAARLRLFTSGAPRRPVSPPGALSPRELREKASRAAELRERIRESP
jgi:hypothetical protein